jgi:hypothetical protein
MTTLFRVGCYRAAWTERGENELGHRVVQKVKRKGDGWVELGCTHGDGRLGWLGRLQSEARFQPKATKENIKPSLFQHLSIKSKSIPI